MDKKNDDIIESQANQSDSSLVYKIGSGIIGGVYGVASTSFNLVKSGSSIIYNNIPLTGWNSKPDENNNEIYPTISDKKSEEKAGWSFGYSKRKDKND